MSLRPSPTASRGLNLGLINFSCCLLPGENTAAWFLTCEAAPGPGLSRRDPVLEEPSLLTSYSWRRLGTTVGLLANFSVPQLAALGDWGDRISDTQAKMPVRYAGARYALSRFCKHYAYCVASHVRDYTAWEVIPPPAVDEACRLAKDEAALAVEQDCTVVWSSPARSSLEPPRLRLTAAARARGCASIATPWRTAPRWSCRRSLATSVRDQRCVMGPFYARSGTKVSASMVTLVLLLTAVPRSIGQAESVVGTTRLWSAVARRCSAPPHHTCPEATCQEERRRR